MASGFADSASKFVEDDTHIAKGCKSGRVVPAAIELLVRERCLSAQKSSQAHCHWLHGGQQHIEIA